MKCKNRIRTKRYNSTLYIYKDCGVCEACKENKKKFKFLVKQANKKSYKVELQNLVNKIVRLIDFEQPCICCQDKNVKIWHAGHKVSVGANNTLRYNFNNIHKQDNLCNFYFDLKDYEKGLKLIYGKEYLKLVNNLPLKYPLIKFNAIDIKNAIEVCKVIIKELTGNKTYDSNKRLELRNEYNKRLGLYK